MKTLFAFLFTFVLVSNLSFGQTTQTEEYAIMSVYQIGKKNYISVTIGSQSTEEREYEAEKSAKRYDAAPIIAKMEELNKMGYELFSSSASMTPIVQGLSGNINTVPYPFYSFVFCLMK